MRKLINFLVGCSLVVCLIANGCVATFAQGTTSDYIPEDITEEQIEDLKNIRETMQLTPDNTDSLDFYFWLRYYLQLPDVNIYDDNIKQMIDEAENQTGTVYYELPEQVQTLSNDWWVGLDDLDESLKNLLNNITDYISDKTNDFSDGVSNTYKDFINGLNTTINNTGHGIACGVSWIVNGSDSQFYNERCNNNITPQKPSGCLVSPSSKNCKNDTDYSTNFDSGYRNYYYTDNSNTNYTNIINRNDKTINYYDTTTNNWTVNNINNTYYDITNNSYYYTTNNYNYEINYNYNYTNMYIINPGGSAQYKYYFVLPDGRDSFNLTEEDIKGVKLDLKAENYKDVYDSENTLLLMHFDGDTFDSSFYNRNSYVDGAIDYLTTDSNNFDAYMYSKNWSRVYLGITEDELFSDNFSLSYRLYKYSTADKSMLINIDSTYKFYYNVGILEYDYYNVPYYISNTTYSNIILDPSLLFSYTQIGASTPVYQPKYPYIIQISNKIYYGNWNVSNPNSYTTDFNFNILNDINFSNDIWNTVLLEYNKSTNEISFYLNGVKQFSFEYTDGMFKDDICIHNYGYMLDEVRITRQLVGKDNYTVPTAPFDTNLVYVLPELDSNNKVLMKTQAKITNQQFCGVRPSSPTDGYAYFSCDENGVITSAQIYDKDNWLEVDSSVYNAVTQRWENIIGYSVYTGTWQEPDEPSGGGDFDDSGIIAKLDEVIEAIKSISVNIVNEAGTNIWDFLTSCFNGILDGIKSVFGGVYELFSNLFIPSDDFMDTEFDEYINEFKLNLGFLWQPVEIIQTTLESFQNAQETANYQGFVWEDIKEPYTGVVIIGSGHFNLKQYINDNYSDLYNTFLIISDGIIYGSLMWLVYKKLMDIIQK